MSKYRPPKDFRTIKAQPGWSNFGSDSSEGSSPVDISGRATDYTRDGGNRFFRGIDLADRMEREARGHPLRHTWRTMVGPVPLVGRGDRVAAIVYLTKLMEAKARGGWSSNEATGLYRAIDVWRARARGNDPRYEEVGNRQGGLTKLETTNVKDRKIIQAMMDRLVKHRDNQGD